MQQQKNKKSSFLEHIMRVKKTFKDTQKLLQKGLMSEKELIG